MYSLSRLRSELRGARPSIELLSVFAKADLLDAARSAGFQGVLSAASTKESVVKAVLRLLEADSHAAAKHGEDEDGVGDSGDDENADFIEAADPSRGTPWVGGGGAGAGAGATFTTTPLTTTTTTTTTTVNVDARAADGANMLAVDFDAECNAWEDDARVPQPSPPLTLSSLITDTSAAVRTTSHAYERVLLATHPQWLVPTPLPPLSTKKTKTLAVKGGGKRARTTTEVGSVATKREVGTQWSPRA